MLDFQGMRQNMVQGQFMPQGVTHPSLVRAFEKVPRELFVPLGLKGVAYTDDALELMPDRHLLPPLSFAKLIQCAGIKSKDEVLDVGCGFGYSSIILSFLAKKVAGVENSSKMIESARMHQEKLGITNLHFKVEPLTEGWAPGGPYDFIILEGVVDFLPDIFLDQLKEKGALLAFEQKNPFVLPTAMKYFKDEGHLTKERLFQGPAPILKEFKTSHSFQFRE